MYRVCGLWLSPNHEMRTTAEKKFYLRLTIAVIRTTAISCKMLYFPTFITMSSKYWKYSLKKQTFEDVFL